MRDAECRKCGKRGHTEMVCRRPTDARGGVEQRDFARVAFTAWQDDDEVEKGVWGTRFREHLARDNGPEQVHKL